MSMRFEWDNAYCNLELVEGGTELGENDVDPGKHALIIGNPWGSAYVIEDTLNGLRHFVRRITDLVGGACAVWPAPQPGI